MTTPVAFPTGVGMNRKAKKWQPQLSSVPHGRGDEPESSNGRKLLEKRSPRAWG